MDLIGQCWLKYIGHSYRFASLHAGNKVLHGMHTAVPIGAGVMCAIMPSPHSCAVSRTCTWHMYTIARVASHAWPHTFQVSI